MTDSPFQLWLDEEGRIASISLFDQELLDASAPSPSELWVNGLALPLRPHVDPNHPGPGHLKGERWSDHFSGGRRIQRASGYFSHGIDD